MNTYCSVEEQRNLRQEISRILALYNEVSSGFEAVEVA